jgi:hypothetical protein
VGPAAPGRLVATFLVGSLVLAAVVVPWSRPATPATDDRPSTRSLYEVAHTPSSIVPARPTSRVAMREPVRWTTVVPIELAGAVPPVASWLDADRVEVSDPSLLVGDGASRAPPVVP